MSSSTTSTLANAKKPTGPPTELKFFLFSDPAEAKSRDNKRLVRSHVALTSHAKTRHARACQRELTPRNSQDPKLEDDLQADDNELFISSIGEILPCSTLSASTTPFSVATQISFSLQPMTLLNLGIQDPFQPFLQHLSHWEQFLFNHCKLHMCLLVPFKRSSKIDNSKPQMLPSLSPADTTHATILTIL
jgi:hypothetical protein